MDSKDNITLNIQKKRVTIMMGICLMAGSLSACTYDTSVTAEPIRYEELAEPISGKEEMAQNSIDNSLSEDVTYVSDEQNESNNTISITISAVGDVTLGNYLTQDYAWSFRETYDKQQDASYFLENVYDIFSEDDMTIVNLEGPLTYSENGREGEYIIKGDPEYIDILTSGSVEAAGFANNHRLDYGDQGTKDTVAALKNADIVYAYDNIVGIYETQQGIRIGIVAVNEIGWGQGVEKLLKEGIDLLKEDGVDLILASCHWGTEREYYPEEYQRTLGKKCIDWGADLVLGHHPHVLQGIEEYQGKYIVYSLGNFCFGANRNPADKDTMIFQQTFTFVDGEQSESMEIKVVPCSVSSITDRNDYRPTPATGEEAVRIINKINELSRDFGVQFDAEGNPL